MDIKKQLAEIRKQEPKRKFNQTLDVIINLKNYDAKKQENRFVEEVALPEGRGKDVKVGVIGVNLVVTAKGKADELINEQRLAQIEGSPKDQKQLLRTVDYFISEPQFMARIGKSLGKRLGPKGKMPKPVPGTVDPKPMIDRLKKTVRVVVKDAPVISCPVGTEQMSDEALGKNLEAVLGAVEKRLPNGRNNIKAVYLKTTMGAPVKVI